MATRTLYDEDGNPIEVEVQETNDDGPANLRKALKKEQAERAAERAELEALKTQIRASTVENTLTAKGVPAKIAKFIPSDVTTPEQINGWLTENADVFGFQPSNEPEAPQDDARQQLNADLQRINNATNTATSGNNEADLRNQINNAVTKADLDAITGVGYQATGRRVYT
jgi:hypothetical protein